MVVQKYLHDMSAWNALTVEQQERVIGRTKLADIELPDDVKPPDSHVALTTIVDADGTERQIVRANMPFATLTTGERGTYFIGYAASADVLEQMLTNMFVGRPARHHRPGARLLDREDRGAVLRAEPGVPRRPAAGPARGRVCGRRGPG